MNVVEILQKEQLKKETPTLRAGDTVRVHVKVVEGTRERLQVFEGIVIGLKGKKGLDARFIVRRIANGVGVERSFLVHSPRIERIDVIRHGDVRRAKLYYLRDKIGKAARIRERRDDSGDTFTKGATRSDKRISAEVDTPAPAQSVPEVAVKVEPDPTDTVVAEAQPAAVE